MRHGIPHGNGFVQPLEHSFQLPHQHPHRISTARPPLTVAAAVARLPAAVNHVLLAEQQLLAGGAVPRRLDGTHRAKGLQGRGGKGQGTCRQ